MVNLRKLILFIVYKVLMRNFLRFVIGVKFDNTEHLKNIEQFVLVANHNSHADTMILMSSLPIDVLYRSHPVAAGDYFKKNKLVGFLVKYLVNAVFVYRDGSKGAKGSNLYYLDQHIKNGRSLILFPEGSRGEPGKLQEFRSGVGVLLKQNPNVPFVPAYISNADKVMPKGEGIPVPFVSYVKFGQATKIGEQDKLEITNNIKTSILGLGGLSAGSI